MTQEQYDYVINLLHMLNERQYEAILLMIAQFEMSMKSEIISDEPCA